jgi:hypothetical protein
MIRKLLRKQPVPKSEPVPIKDYTHLAYSVGERRKIGRIKYVDFHNGEPLYYVQTGGLLTTVQEHQIINRFGR